MKPNSLLYRRLSNFRLLEYVLIYTNVYKFQSFNFNVVMSVQWFTRIRENSL